MIRHLPRGPYGAFLHAHYLRDKADYLPRFAMGQGAVFSVQRTKSLEASLVSPGLTAETDPLLLEELAALVASLNIDVVSLDEMRRRIVQKDFKRRFVCFTFDGGYRSVVDKVLPLFKSRGMPFAVFVSAEHMRQKTMPWWLALEVIIAKNNRVIMDLAGEKADIPCLSNQEKRDGYAALFRRLLPLNPAERTLSISRAFKTCIISEKDAWDGEMLNADYLRQLAQNSLVTIGSLAGETQLSSDMSFDALKSGIQENLDFLGEIAGSRPRYYAHAGSAYHAVPERIVSMIRELGLDAGLGNVEGALWPEHDNEMHALPRIALDNDPATLVRALMLGAEATPISQGYEEPIRRAS